MKNTDKQQIFTKDRKFFFCECGAKVSVDAKACPSCGDAKAKAKAEKREWSAQPVWIKTIPWVVMGGILFGVTKCVSSMEPAAPTCDVFYLRDAAIQQEFGVVLSEARRDLRLTLPKTDLGAGHVYFLEDAAGKKFRLLARAKNYGQQGACQDIFTQSFRTNDHWEAL